MHYWFGLALALLLLLTAGCNLAKDTADTTEESGSSAVGLAEDMSEGTVGSADVETGTLEGEDDEELGIGDE